MTDWQESYVHWLESIVIHHIEPTLLCGEMIHRCGRWCEENCDSGLQPKCLAQAFNAGIIPFTKGGDE